MRSLETGRIVGEVGPDDGRVLPVEQTPVVDVAGPEAILEAFVRDLEGEAR